MSKARKKWCGIFITAPTVAGILMGLRFAGVLQLLELAALDQFFLLRPLEPIDSQIAIVSITEADVQTNLWPLPYG